MNCDGLRLHLQSHSSIVQYDVKLLMMDTKAGREAYRERKIDDMGWVKSNGNLADGLTKLKKAELIHQVMRTRRVEVIADQ